MGTKKDPEPKLRVVILICSCLERVTGLVTGRVGGNRADGVGTAQRAFRLFLQVGVAAPDVRGGRGGAVLLRHPFDFLKAKHVSMAGLAELKLRLGSKRLVPIPGCDGIVCWVCVALVINDYGVLQA